MLLLAIMYNYDSILKHKWIYKRCNNCEVISVNIKNMASAFFERYDTEESLFAACLSVLCLRVKSGGALHAASRASLRDGRTLLKTL